jgi:hypothetical protein
MVDGTVRAIEQVGNNIWVGGKFTQVKQRNGTVVANVSNNLAVFDSETNQYKDIAALPKILSENFSVNLEQGRISPRMGVPIVTVLEGDAPYERGYHNE